MIEKSSTVRLVDDVDESPTTIDQRLIAGVEVVLQARLGKAVMSVAALTALKAGDCVTLDSALNQGVELLLNEVTIARGELVVVDDRFGVRIVEIASA